MLSSIFYVMETDHHHVLLNNIQKQLQNNSTQRQHLFRVHYKGTGAFLDDFSVINRQIDQLQ